MYGYLYYENKGLERLPEDVGLFQISVFNTKNLYFFFYVFGTLLACAGSSNPWENMSNPLQVQGNYNTRGPQGYQHILGGAKNQC